MKTSNKLKIFNDPIYGFITIPNSDIFDLIEHKYFQRLRRISQMGLSYLVYPGAHHTRFHHAIGCMHLMQKAVQTLRFKGVSISGDEENALYIAILLHDIGHGPFSHAMEHSIVEEVHHEEISLKFMNALNVEFEGKLDLANIGLLGHSTGGGAGVTVAINDDRIKALFSMDSWVEPLDDTDLETGLNIPCVFLMAILFVSFIFCKSANLSFLMPAS